LRYRLLGYDHDWRDLQVISPRAVNYTNLPAGSYTFEVMAANNAGVWAEQPTRLAFRIKPHFHETGLFLLLVLTLMATILYAGFRTQRRAHEAQRAQLEQQVNERTQQLHAANLQLEHASQTDPLTGLRNRRYLANQIPADLAFYDREHARGGGSDNTLVFALVDIDHFKGINDTYGHKAGDRILQQFAQVMARLVRTGDYVVRWGGEEFLLVFRPMPRQYVSMIGERIRHAVSVQLFDIGGDQRVPVTCSVGLAEYPLFRDAQQQLGWEQMVELADAALYLVKHNGRNGWAVLRPTQKAELTTLIRALQSGTQTLIDNGRLDLTSSYSQQPPSE
jgi:diguanylate cyclase (GGDEF)-like protein